LFFDFFTLRTENIRLFHKSNSVVTVKTSAALNRF